MYYNHEFVTVLRVPVHRLCEEIVNTEIRISRQILIRRACLASTSVNIRFSKSDIKNFTAVRLSKFQIYLKHN